MRRLVVAAAVLVPLVSAGVVFGVPNPVDECWRRMEAWTIQAEHHWRQQDFAREPAWGEARSGSAFADYAAAIEAATALGRRDQQLLRDLRLRPETVPPEQQREFAARWQPVLAAVAAGAHRTDARPPLDWDLGYANESARLLVGRDVMNAAVIEVRRRLAAGEPRRAVELALDAATYGTDLLQSPALVDQMVASALVAIALGEGLRDADLPRLGPVALALLADGLRRIDARCPLVFDWRGDSLLLANTLLAEGADLPLGDDAISLRTIEYGWSERWAAADAVLTLVSLWERQQPRMSAPWAVRSQQLERIAGLVEVQANPVLRTVTPNWVGAERSLRTTATVVRLLRVAVALSAGDAAPELDDPFGEGPLSVVRREDGVVVVRSVGERGGRPLERTLAPR